MLGEIEAFELVLLMPCDSQSFYLYVTCSPNLRTVPVCELTTSQFANWDLFVRVCALSLMQFPTWDLSLRTDGKVDLHVWKPR